MLGLKYFHIFFIIIYSFFQCYQIFSSVKVVFFDDKKYYSDKPGIQYLIIFQAIGMLISSAFLVIGSLKLKIKLLIGAICYLMYKLCFMSWQFIDALGPIAGCNSKEYDCDPDRFFAIYRHLFIMSNF